VARVAKALSAIEIQRLTAPGYHAAGTVPGLYLRVTETGARGWILRTVIGQRRRDIGLGGYPAVTLAMAHAQAREAKQAVRLGTDPIEARKAAKSALLAQQAQAMTFEQCATAYLAAHESGWRNAKHGQQWRNTLATYAYPVLGRLLVRDVEMPHVLKVLEPIWRDKTETASRLRGRIESVLDWATTRGYREGANPARWKGHLDNQLTSPKKVAKVEHHAALGWNAAPGFLSSLHQQNGTGARALEFAILTAARSGEVRGATWEEIDLDEAVWTIPAGRMKAGKEHRVPLSRAALKLLKTQRPGDDDEAVGLVFPAPRGGQLSDMTLSAVLRRMKVDAVPHGFRSTFRDWAAERTSYPRDVVEMALAHAIGDKVEAAYRRGDLFEKRRRLMTDWSSFLATTTTKGNVVPMPKSKKA
jgi:integrase